MTKNLIFVYGTLKRGQPNHNFLTGDKSIGSHDFQGIGRTLDRYPLVIATSYNIPLALAQEGEGEVSYLSRHLFVHNYRHLFVLPT